MNIQPVTNFYSIAEDMAPYLRRKMRGYRLETHTEPFSEANLKKDTEILGVFVDSNITKEHIRAMPHLGLIATMSTGYDHIDIAAAKKRGIPVCTVPNYGEHTVAEHAMALLLSLSRNLFQSIKRVKEAQYDYHGLRGFDLKGKTVGVIGTGRIGVHLITMLKGFGVRIFAHDKFKNMDAAKKFGFIYLPLLKLLAVSDILSFHLPLLPDTYHILNKKNIKKIKKGAIIINTARGGLIDPEALVWGLESGRIAGAGLDVLESEAFLQHPSQFFSSEKNDRYAGATPQLSRALTRVSLMNEVLIDHPRTIITPHNAFNSTEALQRIMDTTVDNVIAFSHGHPANDVSRKK